MFYRVVFIFMFFLSLHLHANTLLDVKTFESDFEQKIVNSTGKEIVYQGKVYIKEPAKILWKYQTPIEKNVYVITNIAIVDEPELEQVIYTKLHNEVNLLRMIRKSQKVNDNLYLAKIGEIEYEITLDGQDIKKVTYSDTLENVVTIFFKNSKLNETIENSTFQFFPPEHYDIIRQ